MEQQPPQGAAFAVQQLLMMMFRQKVQLMYSYHIQTILGLPRKKPTDDAQMIKEQRRTLAVQLAAPHLSHLPLWHQLALSSTTTIVTSAEERRQCDLADAMCNILAWCKMQHGISEASTSERSLEESKNDDGGDKFILPPITLLDETTANIGTSATSTSEPTS